MPMPHWLLLLLATLAGGQVSGSYRRQPRELEFGSTDEACMDAQHMLQYSIPLSCNSNLARLLASLPDITQLATLGDLCSSYCLYPLRQAAVVCQEIAQVFQVISAACCSHPSGETCFELVHEEVSDLLQEQCPSAVNSTECTLNCSAALEEAHSATGCCFNAIFNTSTTSELYPFSQAEYWTACGQTPPGFCTWCGLGPSSDSPSRPSLGALTALLTMAAASIVP